MSLPVFKEWIFSISSKLRLELSFSDSINWTANWFKASQTNDPLQVTTDQIKEFLAIN